MKKKLICLVTGIVLILSMMTCVTAAAEYDRVSLGYTDSVFVKTEVGSTPQQIKVFGITDNAYGEAVTKTDLTGSEGLTYTISDENVASVSSDGYLTIKDYGIATLTVTDGKTTASVLISVTAKGALGGLNSNGEVFTFDGDSFPFESRSNCEKETVNVRRGDGAALIKSDCLDLYCSDRWGTNAGSSGYVEAWFYDPGQLDDGTWAAGTPFGWFDHNDVGAAEGNPNYGWGRADLRLQMHDQIGAMYGNATYKMSKNSTDIKRTKGWHQLVILAYNDGTIDDETRKKPSGNLIGQEQLMNRCRFFIDGQETAMDGFPDGTVFAGCLTIRANGGSGCPVDDIGQYRYIDMKAQLEGTEKIGETLTASYEYINTYDAVKTENIKWFRGEGDTWAEIEGAAGKTYTLTADDVGKFVKAEIAVTAADNNDGTNLTEKTTTAKRTVKTTAAVKGASPEGATASVDYASGLKTDTNVLTFNPCYANGVTTFDFYDDGVSGGLLSFKSEGSVISEYFKLYADNKYTFNADQGTPSVGEKTVSLDRSEGWHTIKIKAIADLYTYEVYLDNTLVHKIKTASEPTGIRYINAESKDQKVIPGSSRTLWYKTLKTEPLYTVTVNKNNGGEASVDNAYVENGGKTTLTVVPSEGYSASVKVNGSQVAFGGTTFEITNITENVTVDVTFTKNAPEVPTVSKTDIIANADYNGKTSAVVYAKVTGSAKGAGIILKDSAGHELVLNAFNADDSIFTSGTFGIRVFGEALVVGNQYKYIPFVTYASGDGEVTDKAAEEEFTFGE